MKMVKKTGLVPVRSLGKRGEVFGVKPEVARAMLAAKQCDLVEIPEEIETVDVPGLAPAKEAATPSEPGQVITIPDDWESLQHLKRVKLAKEILGAAYAVPEGKKPVEYADEAIRAEIQRRTAADAPAE